MIKRENVSVFIGSNGNQVNSMLKYVSENFDGGQMYFIDRDSDETVRSYRILFVVDLKQLIQLKYLNRSNLHVQNLQKIFSDKIGREYGLQPELLRGEIEQHVIKKTKFARLRHYLEPYLKSDVLVLAFIHARHTLEMQNMSRFGI